MLAGGAPGSVAVSNDKVLPLRVILERREVKKSETIRGVPEAERCPNKEGRTRMGSSEESEAGGS